MENNMDEDSSSTVNVNNAKNPLKSEEVEASTHQLSSLFLVCLGLLCVILTANIVYMSLTTASREENITRLATVKKQLIEEQKMMERKFEEMNRDRHLSEVKSRLTQERLTQDRGKLNNKTEELNKERDELSKQKRELSKEKDKLNKEKDELNKYKDILSKEKKELSKENYELNIYKDKLSKEKKELNKKNIELSNKRKELNKEKDELNKRKGNQSKMKAELSRKTEKLNKEKEDLNKKKLELNKEKEELNKKKVDLSKETAGLHKEKQEFSKKKADLNKAKTDLNKKKEELNKETANLSKKTEQLSKEKADLNKVKADQNKMKAELNKMKVDLSKEKAELNEEKQKLSVLRKESENRCKDRNAFKTFYDYVMKFKTFPVSEFCPPDMRPKCLVCRAKEPLYKGHCYFIQDDLKSSMTWDLSRKLCHVFGSDLVVIDDLQEQEFITLQIKYYETWKRFWIGLYHTPGGWVWVDGRKNTHDFWMKGIPHTSGAALHIPQRTATDSWRAEDKNAHNSFICKRPVTVWPYN
ncbi:PREDICTED: spindle pole body component 110-like [Poecilia mexicana]|uniref:spindle pole body component 110-like n=1 Tax=Poecilia mexicana TaxID=48701 RepID=UPI00072EEF0B|nr:PREDICTED: spindle pole body component 110-like [Poecilia mexicana]